MIFKRDIQDPYWGFHIETAVSFIVNRLRYESFMSTFRSEPSFARQPRPPLPFSAAQTCVRPQTSIKVRFRFVAKGFTENRRDKGLTECAVLLPGRGSQETDPHSCRR